MSAHYLTEWGTVQCPVEGVRADVDGGTCSACGSDDIRPNARLAACTHESGCDRESHDIRCNNAYYRSAAR